MKIQTKILGSLALTSLLMLGFTGCGSDDDTVAAPSTITPYTRVAVITQADATETDVANVADKIAHYVTLTDETDDNGHNFPGGWVIAGANKSAGGEAYSTADLLPIPSAGTAYNRTNGIKSRVIEFCNGTYATMATNTGRFHGSALPCEVSVHTDGENIYIDMLNADAIFSLFFTDISDPDGSLEAVASAVNAEIREMILAALDDTTVAASDANTSVGLLNPNVSATITTPIEYTESTLAMGPAFTQAEIDEDVSLRNPYIVFKYKADENTTFATNTHDKNLAQRIINTMGEDGLLSRTNVPGISEGSGWKSARPETLAIPGVRVVEACSGLYAGKATKLGNEYITALPCEITVYVDDNATDYNATAKTSETIAISFLNPSFMFGTMFQNSVANAYLAGEITEDDVIEYSTLADVVFSDLRLIVDQAIKDYADDYNITLVPDSN